MGDFAKSLRPQRTLTLWETKKLLDASGRHADTFRDPMAFALAFGLGLRVHEIAALGIGDVYTKAGAPRRRLALTTFKGCAREPGTAKEMQMPPVLATRI